MEKLQFDALNVLSGEIADRLQHLFPALAGQTQNDMDNGFQVLCPQSFQSIGEGGERVAAADETGGILMDCLQAELQLDRLFLV